MGYGINDVSSLQELKKSFNLFKVVFKGRPIIDNPEYSFEKWEERMEKYSDLMLFASKEDEVIGLVFGRLMDSDNLTIALLAVDENYRRTGIAKKMIHALEERAKKYHIKTISLGSVESAEKFYVKMGYKGSLLVQSQVHSIDELFSLKTGHKVSFTNIYDGKVSQVCLELDESDRKLQKKYESAFTGCYTQMLFRKIVNYD
ncbi:MULTISPECIES: GNAT family N-acetyltransferase [unclassified Fusibacter]|uniref:GNAT family N-acetyltransferase n=1 Tax=unclassified Fusibacter TaxID=2624464 RepID=UPI0010128173|nr:MULTISPECIES: GNAT family N-acetyltransferase [unclassified Fusibacter]MCK8059012.1 GNAT family N-acetyltransferase [Fusibacter sp. A2]NPE22423.1 GNAT family N-acetyltransferase [Fusibacter sp. A1]RXV60529.1 GNAT family N-acetyltransferase [Fusibacter sp. A1]